MPVTSGKQKWQVGQTVKVGFLTLKVIKFIPTPRDGMPDEYQLTDASETKLYSFIPHNGLTRLW